MLELRRTVPRQWLAASSGRDAVRHDDGAAAAASLRPLWPREVLDAVADAKERIVAEVDRLRWRIWNGKAKDARITFDRIRWAMRVYQGEHGRRHGRAASPKLWQALHEIDGYPRGPRARLVNDADRYRAGLRVGSSVTEATAIFLVMRRMNKSQPMRWTRGRADLLLQVRCAADNGTLDSALGRRFEPTDRPDYRSAMPA